MSKSLSNLQTSAVEDSISNSLIKSQLKRENREIYMEKFVQNWMELLQKANDEQTLSNFEQANSHIFCKDLLTGAFGLVYGKDFEVEKYIKHKRTDCIVHGKLIIEMKSPRKDLETAYKQAKNQYWDPLPEDRKPRFIITCNFEQFQVYDLNLLKGRTADLFGDADELMPVQEFRLDQLPKMINRCVAFQQFIPTEQFIHTDLFEEALALNRKAAEKVGRLHLSLKKSYSKEHQHDLELLLVRLVFCLFAEDRPDLFPQDCFRIFLNTQTDPNNIGDKLYELFTYLDTDPEFRKLKEKQTPDYLKVFPYVNGGLFRETIRVPPFSKQQRDLLLDCTDFNWADITPEIFGSIFQSALDEKKRDEKGQHYTSTDNIMKVIKPLFLDDLNAELNEILQDTSDHRDIRLLAFQDKISKLKFIDPACGCGNFLVVTYQQLRQLELTVLKELKDTNLLIAEATKVNIHQFYGIEIEDFPHEVAKLSLWLMELICNKVAGRAFGQHFRSIPLRSNDNIVCKDALDYDWNTLLPAKECSYVLGNPPFVGHKNKKKEQSEQLKRILGTKDVDYVTAWYKLAADYMVKNKNVRSAFVSTNSVCQGKHPYRLWKQLFALGIDINFYYNTFKWSNEAKGVAAVHCIIVGFRYGLKEKDKRFIFTEVKDKDNKYWKKEVVNKITAYGMKKPNIIVEPISKPLSAKLPMKFGNMPADDGNLIIEGKDYQGFIELEPKAKKYLKRYYGADEFINNGERYCLWLKDVSPSEIRQMKEVCRRVENVRKFRAESTRTTTQEAASRPHEFMEIRDQGKRAILVPSVSSENRKYIPLGFIDDSAIASNATLIVPNAEIFEFGILTSNMHMVWMRFTCGRLKSDYRYAKDLCYNTFYWPKVTDEQKANIEKLAQAVLDRREELTKQGQSLADMYDSMMPDAKLMKAHEKLDKAVDKLYQKSGFSSDEARLDFLASKYEEMVHQSSKL